MAFYEERVQNVERIVKDLQTSTRPPDQIIIFTNNENLTFVLGNWKNVALIGSSKNYSTRAKYVACLLEPSDFYLLIDDDITVGKETIEHLERNIPLNVASFCTSNEGVKLLDGTFSNVEYIREFEIKEPTEADSLIGSFVFCSFEAICNMLEAEVDVRLKDKEYLLEGDDILMGLANRPITIYPAEGEKACKFLNEQGVRFGLIYGNYKLMRDKFTAKALSEGL